MSLSSKAQSNILLIMFLIVALFIFSFVAILGAKIFGEFNDNIQSDSDISQENKDITQNLFTKYSDVFDAAFITILFFAWLVLIATGYSFGDSPVWFIITIVVILITLYVGSELANSYDDTFSDSDLSGSRSLFPMTDLIMSNFLIVILVFGGSAVLSLYGGSR